MGQLFLHLGVSNATLQPDSLGHHGQDVLSMRYHIDCMVDEYVSDALLSCCEEPSFPGKTSLDLLKTSTMSSG